MVDCGYHVELPGGELAYVYRAGILQMVDGSRRPMPDGCRSIKPVHFDRKVRDWHLIEHWATVRLASLLPDASVQAWREAVGAAPVLTAAERLGWVFATPLLQAFGIKSMKTQGQLVEWAFQLQGTHMQSVRRVAREHGIGPVLVALELAGHEAMYLTLANENGVECVAGRAWR